jgi:hypothetical protein
VVVCRAVVVWAECTKSPHRAIYPEARHCRAEESKSKKGVSVQSPRCPFFFYLFPSAGVVKSTQSWVVAGFVPEVPFVLGPKEVATGALSEVPFSTVKDVQDKKKKLYFYGWVRIFPKTPRHVSVFCVELSDVRVNLSPILLTSLVGRSAYTIIVRMTNIEAYRTSAKVRRGQNEVITKKMPTRMRCEADIKMKLISVLCPVRENAR